MTSQDQLDNVASALVHGARAFSRAAEQQGSHLAAPAALDSLQEALQTLSAGWYRLAADAAPGDGLTREQEVRLTGALHDIAAAFARCARTCREGRSTVTPIVSRRSHDVSWFSSRTAQSEGVA